MGAKKNLITELRRFKQNLGRKVPIQRMILFGSYATGKTHKWSDIDLLIVSPVFRRRKAYQRARGFTDYWTMKKPVDFLCYTPEEFNKLQKKITLVRAVVREGKEI